MRVAEIVDLAASLNAATDAEGFAASLGRVRERVGEWLLLVDPTEPRWREARIEKRADGRVDGVAFTLKVPEAVRWDQVAARYGNPEPRAGRVDDDAAKPSLSFVPARSTDPHLIVQRADDDRVAGVILRVVRSA